MNNPLVDSGLAYRCGCTIRVYLGDGDSEPKYTHESCVWHMWCERCRGVTALQQWRSGAVTLVCGECGAYAGLGVSVAWLRKAAHWDVVGS